MFQEILPNVFAFISENEGSNCFLLKGGKQTALIDSSTAENKHALFSSLSKLSLHPKDISLILHTHGHADHFGLDKEFPEARIAMHELDAQLINSKNQEFACTQFFPNTPLPKISLFLKDSQTIDFGNFQMQTILTPGHTAGSVCFFLASENALFSGDTLFAEGFGRTDLPTGNTQKMLESLKKLQKMPLKALLPAHGPVLQGKEQIARYLARTIEFASANVFL